jgi:diguanylate cyclase (GGDEF)-like protein
MVVILLLGVTWAVGAYSVGQVNTRLDHTVDVDDAVLSNITGQIKLLDDEETGLRGYLLTGDPAFLAPYTHAHRLLPRLRAQGDRLVAGFPDTRVLLAEETASALAWEAWARDTIRYPPANPRSASAIVNQVDGKQLFDTVRSDASAVTREMSGDRQQDLDQSRLTASRLNVLTGAIFILAVLATLLIGWLTMRAIMRPLNSLRQAADTIGSGDLGRGVMVRGAREFADLAGSMDSMRLQLARANADLEHRAFHDPLTGLPNRDLLHDRLEYAVRAARRGGTSMALFVLDLDGFKDVNDTLGHEAGDAALQEVGRRLQSALRASDTVARLGGDEFAVVLPAADEEAATRIAQKLENALSAPLTVQDHDVELGGSIGIALFSDHGTDPGTLLHHADVAMYMAKRSGQAFSVYTPLNEYGGRAHLALLGHGVRRRRAAS